MPRVDDGQLGLPAAAEQCHHARAGPHHVAGALEPRHVDRRSGRRRIVAGPLHQVRVVEARRADADQELALAGDEVGALLELEAPVADDDGLHRSRRMTSPPSCSRTASKPCRS